MFFELIYLRLGLGAKSQIYIDVAVYSWISMSGLDRFSHIYEVERFILSVWDIKFSLLIIMGLRLKNLDEKSNSPTNRDEFLLVSPRQANRFSIRLRPTINGESAKAISSKVSLRIYKWLQK